MPELPVDPLYLLIASLVGHAIGAAWAWWKGRQGKQARTKAELAERLFAVPAKAIERQKQHAWASGDADDASVVKSITGAIAREAVTEGLEPALTDALRRLGLNESRILGPMLEAADRG